MMMDTEYGLSVRRREEGRRGERGEGEPRPRHSSSQPRGKGRGCMQRFFSFDYNACTKADSEDKVLVVHINALTVLGICCQ